VRSNRELAEYLWCELRSLSKSMLEKWVDEDDRLIIIRVEDDVIVNRHLVHNVVTWPALAESDFVMGTLFTLDGNYPGSGIVAGRRQSGAHYRLDYGIAGLQGVVYDARRLEELAQVRQWLLKHKPSDCSFHSMSLQIYRSMFQLRRPVYVHFPSLVNGHSGSKISAGGRENLVGHYAHKTFKPDWRRKDP